MNCFLDAGMGRNFKTCFVGNHDKSVVIFFKKLQESCENMTGTV